MEVSRREFLATGAAAVLARGRQRSADSPASPRRQPNILLILADDLGFSDIGCYGSEIPTPNIDRLARDGVRFSQAYNTARCCPSRASLLTGLYPHQAGLGLMVENQGVPAYQGYLRSNCVTVAEVLRQAGYRTWMTGKWHVGGSQVPNDPSTWHPGTPEQPTPLDRGFDDFFGTLGGAGSYFRPPLLMDGRTLVERPRSGFYYTQAIGDRACTWVRESVAAGRPFFGYVAFTAPHWPLHALPVDIERHRDRYRAGWDAVRAARDERQRALGLFPSKWPLSPRDPRVPAWGSLDASRRNWESARMAVYAAMVDCLDQNVGRILDCLDETGQREHSVVIFLSDNGGCEEQLHEDGRNITRYDLPMSDGRRPRLGNIPGLAPGPENTFMSYGVGWANVSNTPFRQFKKWVHEGGISTPLVIRHFGYAAHRGRIVHDAYHLIDVMPTILEAAGARHPQMTGRQRTVPLEGRSFLPALAGRNTGPERALFWEHMGNRAIRLGSMKLVADNAAPWELYDVAADRTELKDLSRALPATVADLEKRYTEWAARVGVENFDELTRRRRG